MIIAFQIFKFKCFVSSVFISCISRNFAAVSFINCNFRISICIFSFFLFQSELCSGVNFLVFSLSQNYFSLHGWTHWFGVIHNWMRAFLTVPHFAGIYQQTKLHFYRHYNKKPKQKMADKGQNKGNRIKKTNLEQWLLSFLIDTYSWKLV